MAGEEFDQTSSFSEYKIIKQIGEGGFGRVMLAEHIQTKEKVAIKFVNSRAIGNFLNTIDSIKSNNISRNQLAFNFKSIKLSNEF